MRSCLAPPVHETYHVAYSCHASPSAGTVRALTGGTDAWQPEKMHPGVERHLLQYIAKASPNLLIRLSAKAGINDGVFGTMSHAVVSQLAQAVKRSKHRVQWRDTDALGIAARVLASRLEHCMQSGFKSFTAAQIAEATQALFRVLALEQPGSVSEEMHKLVSTFQKHFQRTTTSDCSEITAELVRPCHMHACVL